jgi:ABC-2 type transport system permease protein
LVGIKLDFSSFLAVVAVTLIVSFALSGLGFCIAWRMSSTQGFHVIMNLFLIPMWFLSGAMFPADGAHGAMRWLMNANPLTYGVSALRRALYLNSPANLHLPPWQVCIGVSLAFAAMMFLISSMIAGRRVAADLQ